MLVATANMARCGVAKSLHFRAFGRLGIRIGLKHVLTLISGLSPSELPRHQTLHFSHTEDSTFVKRPNMRAVNS